MKEQSEFYKSEMKKISAKALDKYNSEEMQYDPNLYKRVIQMDSEYSPIEGEPFATYIIRLKILRNQATKKNVATHVETARGRPWHTHVQPQCFMCSDNQFYTVLVSVLEYIQKKYPKLSL